MSVPSEPQPEVPQEPPAPVRWRSWPAGERLARALAVVVGLLITVVVVGWLSGEAYLGLLAVAALVVALWRFFVPVVYELSGKGVDQRVLGRHRRIPWQAIRRWEVRSAGVLLLPHEDRSAMAPFRGLYLPWGAHREEVLAQVRHYLERPQRAEDSVAEQGPV